VQTRHRLIALQRLADGSAAPADEMKASPSPIRPRKLARREGRDVLQLQARVDRGVLGRAVEVAVLGEAAHLDVRGVADLEIHLAALNEVSGYFDYLCEREDKPRGKVAAYDPAGGFRTWLFAILVNRCRTSLLQRSRYVRRVVTDEDMMHNAVSGDDAGSTELRIEIERAVAMLDSDQREAFLLKHVEQLGYEEMAAVTGAGVSALKMRVKRARDQVRERWKELDDDGSR